MNSKATLAEAERIAAQPIGDRLDGKLADEARSVLLRLLENAGLDYGDAINLLSAVEWDRWSAGYAAALRSTETEEK